MYGGVGILYKAESGYLQYICREPLLFRKTRCVSSVKPVSEYFTKDVIVCNTILFCVDFRTRTNNKIMNKFIYLYLQ